MGYRDIPPMSSALTSFSFCVDWWLSCLLSSFMSMHACVCYKRGVLMVTGGCVRGEMCAQKGIVQELDRRIARDSKQEMEDCEGVERA